MSKEPEQKPVRYPVNGGIISTFGVLCNIDNMPGFSWYLLPNTVTGTEDDATAFAKRLAYSADEDTRYIVVEITETGYKRIGDVIRGELQL